MKGKPTQSPKLTLGDVAYIFQGVGTRDLKIGNEALLGYEECWAVGAAAVDGQANSLLKEKLEKAMVVKRLIDTPLRGSGQKACLQFGDILIANRGYYKVSNMIGVESPKEVWDGVPVFAGATVLVVRAKKQEGEHWPYRLHALLDSPQVKEYLQSLDKNEVGKPWVITKADLESLPLPDNYQKLHPYFHSSARENLIKLEKLDEKSSILRHTRVKAKIWRDFSAPALTRRKELADDVLHSIPDYLDLTAEIEEVNRRRYYRLQEIRVEYPRQPQRENDEPIINAINDKYRDLVEARRVAVIEFVRKLFIAVHDGREEYTNEQQIALSALRLHHGCELKWGRFTEFDEAKRLLADEVDNFCYQNSDSKTTADRISPSVLKLVGKVAARFDSVLVVNPDVGHLPAAIAANEDAPSIVVCPATKDHREVLPFVKAHVETYAAQAVFVAVSVEDYLAAVRERRNFLTPCDAIVADVGRIGFPKFKDLLASLAPGLGSSASCIAYVSANQFSRIIPLLDGVVSLTVLPPLPEYTRAPDSNKLTQGFVVEIVINSQPSRMVTVFDATNAVPVSQVGLDLPEEVVARIAKALNEDVSAEGVERITVSREKFSAFKAWPGLIALKGTSYDHLTSATLETIEDEIRRLDDERKQLQESLASDDKFGWTVQGNQVKEA
jgi:hypothetical protein